MFRINFTQQSTSKSRVSIKESDLKLVINIKDGLNLKRTVQHDIEPARSPTGLIIQWFSQEEEEEDLEYQEKKQTSLAAAAEKKEVSKWKYHVNNVKQRRRFRFCLACFYSTNEKNGNCFKEIPLVNSNFDKMALISINQLMAPSFLC